MTVRLLLRISALVSLIFTAGHTLGGLTRWSPMGDNAVLAAMQNTRFDVMGVQRSYFDFFMGFGWSISASMLMQAVLLWQMSVIVADNPRAVRPMIAAIALATVCGAMISVRFIFPLPALFCVALLVPLAAAWLKAGKSSARERASARDQARLRK